MNDAITGSILVLFALVMIWHTRTFPELQGQDYGPSLFPRLIGIAIAITGLILIGTGLQRRASGPMVGEAAWLRSPRHVAGFLAIVGGLGLYILLSGRLGFMPTAFLLLLGWLVLFRGGKAWSSAAIALAVTIVVNYVFAQLLLVPLPLGVVQWVLY